MTEEAQEVTGMPTPELPDNIRVPLHSLQADVDYLIGRVAADGSCAGMVSASIKERLALIVKAVNAYTSTDALRSALAPFALLADEFRDVVPDDFKIGLFTTSLHEPTVGDLRRARAALSSSPAPSTEGLREALMLAEKADRIHSKCQECEDGAQAPEACEHCFPSADDARVARRNVLKALGVKMRDVDRASPDAARTALAGTGGTNELA